MFVTLEDPGRDHPVTVGGIISLGGRLRSESAASSEFTAIAPYQSETNADNEGGAEAEVRLSVLDDGS